MVSEWKKVPVAEIATRVSMGPFGSNIKTDNFVEYGIPVIRGNNLTDGRFNGKGFVYLTSNKADTLRSANAYPGDVIFTHRGTLGQVGIIPDRPYDRYVVSQSQMVVTCDTAKMLPLFFYYFFKSREGQNALLMNTSQTGVPALSQPVTSLKKIQVPVPPLYEQQAITNILGALDDKIECNCRLNETLEEIATAIFKSWFVDFKPIRYKSIEQKIPNVFSHIAKLFPDRFESSEVGDIPQGWCVRSTGDVAKVLGGGTPSTKEPRYWDNGVHSFCTPKDMSSLISPTLLETERYLTNEGLAKVSSGQLPPGTVLLSSRAPIGYLAISEIPISINQGIIAIVCDQDLPNLYILPWLKQNMDKIIARANGSTFLEISKSNFRSMPILVPPSSILKEYCQVVEPLYCQMINNVKQIKTLEATRDTLLPRLISGELRVRRRSS